MACTIQPLNFVNKALQLFPYDLIIVVPNNHKSLYLSKLKKYGGVII